MSRLLAAAAFTILIAWGVLTGRRPNGVPLNDEPFGPGPWFEEYLSEWMRYHGVTSRDSVTSGIVTGAETGDFIWVTATPEWDRDWLDAHGRSFPKKWVPHTYLVHAVGEPGTPMLLPGL